MSLKALIAQAKRGEILMPRLHRFLAEQDKQKGGALKSKAGVIEDARLTIATFKERIAEYNHGTEIEGEYFHPSQLGRCLRAMWFDHFKAPKPQKVTGAELLRTHMTFETGTYVGVVFQNLCERAGYLTAREVPIMDAGLKILGHADGTLRIDKVNYILEIKTINARNFSLLSGPKDDHKRQCHAYMKALKMNFAIVVYLEKDRHGVKEYLVEFDDDYYSEFVEKRINAHFKSLRTRKPPEREGMSPASDICKWCAFQQVCFEPQRSASFLKQVAQGKQ